MVQRLLHQNVKIEFEQANIHSGSELGLRPRQIQRREEREKKKESHCLPGLLYGNIVLLLEYIIASSEDVGQEVVLYSNSLSDLLVSSQGVEREHNRPMHGLELEVSMMCLNSIESRRPTGLNDSWWLIVSSTLSAFLFGTGELSQLKLSFT